MTTDEWLAAHPCDADAVWRVLGEGIAGRPRSIGWRNPSIQLIAEKLAELDELVNLLDDRDRAVGMGQEEAAE